MAHRISALISFFGVLACMVLLVGAVRQYGSGASALWIVAGALLVLSALYVFVRDVLRLRTGQRS
ncbi:hypothetical protein [Streptomyces peucetius]|uniref:Uncharacterized protein n=1 Tax=Streptomyces peucetius TaxID=1950 RepID=A0ABY6IHA0_STRPE|nr:hypothetical protein [Streptomyces peucetius]UYQ65550.1 hypothetical protein OGH68_31520 [Streptomyces peucetius]